MTVVSSVSANFWVICESVLCAFSLDFSVLFSCLFTCLTSFYFIPTLVQPQRPKLSVTFHQSVSPFLCHADREMTDDVVKQAPGCHFIVVPPPAVSSVRVWTVTAGSSIQFFAPSVP